MAHGFRTRIALGKKPNAKPGTVHEIRGNQKSPPHYPTDCCNLLRSAGVCSFREANALSRTIKALAGGCMKKLIVTLIIGSLLSAATVTPALASEWNPPHVRGGIFNPLWPVVAALSIPTAIAGAVANATVPAPVVVASPPVSVAPPVYAAPPEYYAPTRVYVAPRPYHYAPRAYYSDGYHRPYQRYGW